jgi:hypothetical protein
MTYETAVTDLFARFPRLRAEWEARFAYMGKDQPPHIVFGSLLTPSLEEALAAGNLGLILPLCAFLEDVADASKQDDRLANLLRVEIGEWLDGVANEAMLAPWLGRETKRICGYMPGLAIQRKELLAEMKHNTIGYRLSALLRKIVGK